MTPPGDKPLQIAAAARMIFDKQNFHSGEAKTDWSPGLTARPSAISLKRSESWHLF
jgi:hypothetical protein